MHTTHILALVLLLPSLCFTQLNKGSFKSGVMSYISQVELPANSTRKLLFDLEENFRNCNIVLEYFPRYHYSSAKDGDTQLKSGIAVKHHKQEKPLFREMFTIHRKELVPIKKTLKFDQVGTWEIIMSNLDNEPLIGSIMLDMEGCKDHVPHAETKEMDLLINKVQKMVWKLFEMFGVNEVTESYMEHSAKDMRKSHHRLTYSAISETLAMFIIAFWQVWYIKHVLENKNIV